MTLCADRLAPGDRRSPTGCSTGRATLGRSGASVPLRLAGALHGAGAATERTRSRRRLSAARGDGRGTSGRRSRRPSRHMARGFCAGSTARRRRTRSAEAPRFSPPRTWIAGADSPALRAVRTGRERGAQPVLRPLHARSSGTCRLGARGQPASGSRPSGGAPCPTPRPVRVIDRARRRPQPARPRRPGRRGCGFWPTSGRTSPSGCA